MAAKRISEKNAILRSAEVNEVLTSSHNWIIRWGISAVFVLILIGTSFSYFVSYPDIVVTDIEISTLSSNTNTSQKQFIGRCLLPLLNMNKIATGQTVQIKLENYPYTEMGLLTGKVITITDVDQSTSSMVTVYLTNGLTTSYIKSIPFDNNLKGKAEITVGSISLFHKLFSRLKK